MKLKFWKKIMKYVNKLEESTNQNNARQIVQSQPVYKGTMVKNRQGKTVGEMYIEKQAQLLEWIKEVTKDYPNLNIVDINNSFKNGLAFCALAHVLDPTLFDYNTLTPDKPLRNFRTLVYSLEKLGITVFEESAETWVGMTRRSHRNYDFDTFKKNTFLVIGAFHNKYYARISKAKTLLEWAKYSVRGYPNVNITDLSTSFEDGLAFCAIMHNYRPELIDYHSLSAEDPVNNHKLAYKVGEEIGIPKLLDPKEIVKNCDSKSIEKYLDEVYKKLDPEFSQGYRVNKFEATEVADAREMPRELTTYQRLEVPPPDKPFSTTTEEQMKKLTIEDLLRWSKEVTAGYRNVKIVNLADSFKDGLAYCAIMHRFRPDLINYHSLSPANAEANHKLAFSAGEKLGIPRVLKPFEAANLDKRFIMPIYIYECYRALNDLPRLGGPNVSKLAKVKKSKLPLSAPEMERDAMQAVLKWCQNLTKGKMRISDLSESFANGQALCYIMEAYRPDLIDTRSLSANNAEANFELALSVGEQMGIPRLGLSCDGYFTSGTELDVWLYLATCYRMLNNKSLTPAARVSRKPKKKFLNNPG